MRLVIAAGLLLVAAVIVWEAFDLDSNNTAGSLLLNLGTELVGIILTVAIVDALLERRTLLDEARRMSWNVLHDLDHAVWVWQGGGREFDIEELFELIDQISDADPISDFTGNLLLILGSRSENTVRQRKDIMHRCPELKAAMEALVPLARIRNEDRFNTKPTVIASYLRSGATFLLEATGMVRSKKIPIVSRRNPSLKMQEWRHYGRVAKSPPATPQIVQKSNNEAAAAPPDNGV
jgi:hypothetical protein